MSFQKNESLKSFTLQNVEDFLGDWWYIISVCEMVLKNSIFMNF